MCLIFSAVLLNIPGFVMVGILACFGGVIAFAYYAKVNCDPMTGGQITNPNQVRQLKLSNMLQAFSSNAQEKQLNVRSEMTVYLLIAKAQLIGITRGS